MKYTKCSLLLYSPPPPGDNHYQGSDEGAFVHITGGESKRADATAVHSVGRGGLLHPVQFPTPGGRLHCTSGPKSH